MRTRSDGRPVVESRGGGTGERVGKGGRGRGPKGGNDECVDELNGQRNDQGAGANRNVEGVNRGVGGLETELWNHVMVGTGHAAYTDRFHELARLVPHLVTPKSRKIERYMYGLAPQIRGMVEAMEPKTMQKAVQIFGALTDEAVRNGSIKKVEKTGNVGECSKDKNGRDDNKRTKLEMLLLQPQTLPGHFAKDYKVVPSNVNPVNVKNPAPAREACYECGSIDHLKLACPRLNRAQGPRGNRPNQVVAN
ncbi:hypothetical protein Tco_0931174 [Tanacetum coccineum]